MSEALIEAREQHAHWTAELATARDRANHCRAIVFKARSDNASPETLHKLITTLDEANKAAATAESMLSNWSARVRVREKDVLAEIARQLQAEYAAAADALVERFGELISINRRLGRGEPLAGGRLYVPQVGALPEREPGALWAWQSFNDSAASKAASERLERRITEYLHPEKTDA